MSDMLFTQLTDKIKSRFPNFIYKFKDESNLMKLISKIMFFNKNFMNYTTTFGATVYFPKRSTFEKNPDYWFETLCHEYVHVADDAKHPIWFKLKYALPQILSIPILFFPIIVVLSYLFSPLWLLLLISSMFLAPIPSPGRTQAELRGYGMNVKLENWLGRTTNLNYYVEAFITSAYYFMCPFKNYVTKELEKYKTDDCLNDPNPAYKDVYTLIKR